MFLQFVTLGFVLTNGLISASPFPQRSESQTKGGERTLQQTQQNTQQKQSQPGFQQTQPRNSFPNREFYRPSSNDGFGPGYSDYDDPSLGPVPLYNGYDRRQFRPNSDGRFDSPNFQSFDNGNRPGFAGWNRPIQPRPVFGAGDRGFGGGDRGSDSSDDNQLGSGGIDEQRGSGGSTSSGANQPPTNVGGNGSGNNGQPQTGGQPWTTVRAPVNRIFGEYTIPEIGECIRQCPSVSQYDPICGSDNITYTNRGRMQCARQCGRAVTEAFHGSCSSATVS